MKLWASQSIAQLEATIVDFTIALVVASAVINHLYQFGESSTALVFALQFIPALPAALIAGFVSDIVDRRLLLIGLNVFRSVFLLIFVFAATPGTQLYFFVFITAICMHIYDVVEKATLRNVTSEKELSVATGLFLFTLNATTLFGVLIAGILYKPPFGLPAVLLSGSILYILAAVIAYKLPRNINRLVDGQYVENQNIVVDTAKAFSRLFTNIKDTLRYSLTVTPVWLSVILTTIVQTVTLMIASVSFKYGKDVLNIPPEQVSIFLLLTVSAGLAIGGTLTPFLVKKFSYKGVIMFSWFVASLMLIVFGSIGFIDSNLRPGWSFDFILFQILIFTIGMFVTLIQSPALELIQRFADPQIRGRVFGILVGASNSVAGLLVASSSIIVDILGSQKFMIFVAFVLLFSMFIYGFIYKKFMGKRDYTDFNMVYTPSTEKIL